MAESIDGDIIRLKDEMNMKLDAKVDEVNIKAGSQNLVDRIEALECAFALRGPHGSD